MSQFSHEGSPIPTPENQEPQSQSEVLEEPQDPYADVPPDDEVPRHYDIGAHYTLPEFIAISRKIIQLALIEEPTWPYLATIQHWLDEAERYATIQNTKDKVKVFMQPHFDRTVTPSFYMDLLNEDAQETQLHFIIDVIEARDREETQDSEASSSQG